MSEEEEEEEEEEEDGEDWGRAVGKVVERMRKRVRRESAMAWMCEREREERVGSVSCLRFCCSSYFLGKLT